MASGFPETEFKEILIITGINGIISLDRCRASHALLENKENQPQNFFILDKAFFACTLTSPFRSCVHEKRKTNQGFVLVS